MFHVQMSSMQILLLSLLLSGSLIQSAEGTVKVTVKEDSDAVLPCSLSKNIQTTVFDWKKGRQDGLGVFFYKNSGQDTSGQDKQFEGRVSHFNEELKNGNASIKIRKTEVSDSGNYTCIFPHLQPPQQFTIELVVVACRKPTVTSLEPTNDEALLQCEVEGASPEPKVEWRNSSGNILHAVKTQVTENGGSFIILKTNVTKSDTYTCVVTQDAICHQIKSSTYVQIQGSGSGFSAGWIVYSAVVSIILVLVIVAVAVAGLYIKRHYRKKGNSPAEEEKINQNRD